MAATQKDSTAKDLAARVASQEDNDKLEHVDGGTTTRNDAMDLGVPMLPGSPDEPSGPEDALGTGPKRGDYRARQPEGTIHVESVPNPKGGEPITDKDGNVLDYEPLYVPQVQNERVNDIGDVPGVEGGVDTNEGDKTA